MDLQFDTTVDGRNPQDDGRNPQDAKSDRRVHLAHYRQSPIDRDIDAHGVVAVFDAPRPC